MIAVLSVIAVPALAGPATEKPWFDLENCAMCKSMVAQPGLMDHMTWETKVIGAGMLSTCAVDPAYMTAYNAAGKEMEKVMKDLEAGKTMNVCGMCTSYGTLMKAGAKSDEMMAGNVHVWAMTSTDPAVAKQIQTHAQRTIDEYAKMKAMKAEKTTK
jgi:hypothetical protein